MYDDFNTCNVSENEADEQRWRPLSTSQATSTSQDEPRRFFRFEREGQALQGMWLGWTSGPFGKLGQLETREGVRTFSPSTVLANHLNKLDEGTLVRIRFSGWRLSKAGRKYRDFAVDVAAE